MPPAFREERIEVLHAAIREARLAALVTLTDEGLIASHVPLLLDPAPAPYGTLIGHVASPNPQAKRSVADVAALAIFHG
ncbi:MAG: FMN-binding negative transcriptional regulator, partial [Acetobacteraceae bacterium]